MSIQLDRLWQGFIDTLLMVGVSSLLALLIGLPLAVILVVCSRNSMKRRGYNRYWAGL